MTLKDTDNAVRELQKTVSAMTEKTAALEAKIGEQNAIITNLHELINLLRSEISGNSAKSTKQAELSPAPATALQRPVRQARVNSKAKNVSKSNTTAKKFSAVAAARQRAASESKAAPAQSKPPSNSTPVTTPAPVAAPKSATTHGDSNTSNEVARKDDNDGPEWQRVTRRRPGNKQKLIVIGSGKADENLQSVEKVKYIQAWSFKPETTVQSVLNYLNKFTAACNNYTVEKRNIKTDKHAAFVIGFPESLSDTLHSPSSWPPGVKIGQWFRRGTGAARGARADHQPAGSVSAASRAAPQQ